MLSAPAARAEPQAPATGSFDEGYFLDITGERRAFWPTQEAWFSERYPKPHYLRAAMEAAIFLGLQTISYWARPAANQFDWDDPAFKSRFNLTAVRFDNNLAFTNFVLHPLSGAGTYWLARVNDVSIPIAEMYTVLGSMIWEFLLEWREEVSLNDLIVTPAGGIPTGAFAAALSDYLNSSPDTPSAGNKAAGTVLGFPRLMHPRRVDPNSGPGRLPPDSLGLSSVFWHQFRIGYEHATVDIGNGVDHLNGLVVGAELVSMAGFLRPGRFHKIYAHDNFTEFHMKIGFTPSGHTDSQFRTNASIVGGYSQDFRAVRHGVAGHGELFGLYNSLRYVERTYSRAHDMFASVGLIGGTAGLWLGLGPWRVRMQADAHYDFGAAQSLSFPEYKREHPREQLNSVLEVQGYAYGVGPAGRVRAEAATSGVSLGGYADGSLLHMINGLDRWENRNPHEPNGHDTVLEYGAWIRYEPVPIPIFLTGSLDVTVRSSTLGNVTTDRTDTRTGASFGLNF